MKETVGNDIKNTGAGITLLCPVSRRLLLGLRSPESEHEPETWCNFGGHMQHGETALQAALREMNEEAELRPEKIIENPIYTEENNKGEDKDFKFYNFLGIVSNEVEAVLNHEHLDYNWYRLSEIPYINLHSGFKKIFKDANAMQIIKNHLQNYHP